MIYGDARSATLRAVAFVGLVELIRDGRRLRVEELGRAWTYRSFLPRMQSAAFGVWVGLACWTLLHLGSARQVALAAVQLQLHSVQNHSALVLGDEFGSRRLVHVVSVELVALIFAKSSARAARRGLARRVLTPALAPLRPLQERYLTRV